MKKPSILSDRGMLRLRWTYLGKRESLNLGLEDTRTNRAYAQGVARKIADDIQCGQYDVTKNRYRPQAIGNSALTCCELFDKFAQHKHRDLGVCARSIEARYQPLSKALNQWLNVPAHEVTSEQARDFLSIQRERVTGSTAKARVWLLSACWQWAQEQKLIATSNPWIGLTQGIKTTPTQRVRPFTSEEIQAIIAAFRCSPHYRHYGDFVYFLFGTGCRFGEASGLQWKHVADDFESAWIGESVSRGHRKSTKTGKARTVVLSHSVVQMLRDRHTALNPNPDDLVFPSPKDLPIDDHNFRNRAWKTILQQCRIEYRKPYATRHSAISHALAAGVNPINLAEQSGHNKQVLLSTYAHEITKQSLFVEF